MTGTQDIFGTNPVDVVIMAAGKGTRMKSKLPKVLHRLAGRALVQHVVDTAAALAARQVTVITGHGADEVEAALDDVAALRIAVFRDWPYLYDGTLDYERAYLATYRDNPGALLVGAFDGDRLVGASTSTLMEDHAAEFAAPFAARGMALETILYGAESVLLPEYRGIGLGHRFIDLREDHARAMGRSHVAGGAGDTSLCRGWWLHLRGKIWAMPPKR